jgi:hypothetical protein
MRIALSSVPSRKVSMAFKLYAALAAAGARDVALVVQDRPRRLNCERKEIERCKFLKKPLC